MAILYKDNQSTMLFENNGQKSSRKQTKHINMQYYFSTDRICKNELLVTYCPTELMVANFVTKKLQRAAFVKINAIILNLEK